MGMLIYKHFGRALATQFKQLLDIRLDEFFMFGQAIKHVIEVPFRLQRVTSNRKNWNQYLLHRETPKGGWGGWKS
jgi:hypothetical protein